MQILITRSERSLMTKIRVSAHSLAIETGRYSRPKIPASERFCKFCKNVMEDEKHFILNCPQCETLRGKRILCIYSAGVCPFHLVASFKFGNHKSNVKSVERRGTKITEVQ
jgi:hypothetical protein